MRPEDRPAPIDADAVLALIVAEQARPERRCAYVGTEPSGVRAELDALDPPWLDTVRVVVDASGAVVGAVIVEWDGDLGRSWVHGPWVVGDDEAWRAHAPGLLDAALSQPPASIDRHELCGDLANVLLADLAGSRGWAPSELNHALVVDGDAVDGWPPAPRVGVGAASAGDLDAIAEVHDLEFPDTYASASQLVTGAADGSRVVLVATHDDAFAGYAAGQVHPDGEAFVDFIAVHPRARGIGIGRALTMALTRTLLDSGPRTVALTVQEHREPARKLYESLGFRVDCSIVGYRSWTEPT